jgi:hypothetical protein
LFEPQSQRRLRLMALLHMKSLEPVTPKTQYRALNSPGLFPDVTKAIYGG